MNKKNKLLGNIIFFVLLVVLTLYVLLKDEDIFTIFYTIMSSKLEFLLIGILSMLLYLMCEAINIGRTLKILKEKSSFAKDMKYALIGFFFSSVTPAASGRTTNANLLYV